MGKPNHNILEKTGPIDERLKKMGIWWMGRTEEGIDILGSYRVLMVGKGLRPFLIGRDENRKEVRIHLRGRDREDAMDHYPTGGTSIELNYRKLLHCRQLWSDHKWVRNPYPIRRRRLNE